MRYFTDSPYERLMMERPYAGNREKAEPAEFPCGRCGYGAAKPCIAVCMRAVAGDRKRAHREHRKAELLPRISAHNLRHTACTNMARQGMSIKVLQYLMGHAHSDVTMDVYNHIAGRQDVREEVKRYALAVGG